MHSLEKRFTDLEACWNNHETTQSSPVELKRRPHIKAHKTAIASTSTSNNTALPPEHTFTNLIPSIMSTTPSNAAPSPSSDASDSSENANPDSRASSPDPRADTPTPKVWPPGVNAFLQCQSEESTPEKEELAALATDLLLLVEQEKLCDIVKGARSGQKWKGLFDTIYADGGIFSGYKKWNSNSPWTAKLKPLCLSIIDYFSNEYDKKGGIDATALEELAKTLAMRIAAAEKNKTEEKDRAYARRVQNELVEGDMGYRSNGNGVASPSGIALDSSYKDGLSVLGRQTESVNEAAAITNSATNAARAVAGMTFDASRSRSAFEGDLANCAGKGSAARNMTIRKARQMDHHALTDGLSSALSSSTREFADAIKGLLPSPNSKRQKTCKEIQEEILLVIEEIKGYNAINGGGEFDKDIETAKARLKYLQQQRDNGEQVVIL